MADREVTKTRKNDEGDVTHLCHDGAHWSPRTVEDAIQDIDGAVHRYFVVVTGNEVDIIVVDDPDGKYLRTNPDATTSNNLDELPDC